MADQLTTWEEIEQKYLIAYYIYIICDLGPDSPPQEEDIQLDQMRMQTRLC